jgi:TRAP-type C4-dicarboxylate transport system substrate-binding protein
MKRIVLMLFSIVLLVMMILCSGCAEDTSAPEKPNGESEKEEVIKLTFSEWGPQNIPLGQIHLKAVEMIEERTEGRVKVTPYFSESLIKYIDTYKSLADGVADISLYTIGATPGVHSLNRVFIQPQISHMGHFYFDKTVQIYRELLDQFPSLQEEMEKSNTRWLSLRGMVPQQIHTTNKIVRVPEDMKGMKIIASDERADLVNSVGGAALLKGPPDWYTSLERGLAEGQIGHWTAIHDFKLTELFKYHTQVGDGGVCMAGIGYIVNLDTWNSLPPDIQDILVEVYTWACEEAVKEDIKTQEISIQEAKDLGHTIIELTPDEIQLWADGLQPFTDKWIMDTEAEGWPAREVYKGLEQLIEKYK